MSVVVKGIVSIKVHGLLKTKHLPGSFGVLYDGGGRDNKPPRIQMYEEENTPDILHTIQLEQLKFSDKSFRQQDPLFALSIKKDKHQFTFQKIQDRDDWVQGLCHVSCELWKQRASAVETSDLDDADSTSDMTENMLYDSCDVQHFKVSINRTRTSDSNNLKGHYLLNPTKESLRLLDKVSFKSIHEWPYRQIRKYGRTRNIFRMEVGRRCTTGEGEFEFFTPEGATLTDLITVYTRQAREDDKKQSQEDIQRPRFDLPPRPAEYVDAATPSPQLSPAPLIPRRMSENYKETRDADVHSQPRISTFSLSGSKKEVPKPAPRSNIAPPLAPRQENGPANPQGKVPSSDTKIYETSTGLTAPLDSSLKHELHRKLEVSLPEPDSLSETGSSLGHIEDPEHEPPLEGANGGLERRHSGGAIKEKKKSDKERKKYEKEQKAAEAKRKKQQEKEQKEREKEQKEREKEMEKKTKKESKGHNKVTGKKSDSSLGGGAGVGHIYDEPEELMKAGIKERPHIPEPDYAEADNFRTAPSQAQPQPASQPEGDIYSLPIKVKKDSWKKHALSEREDGIHQEDYDSIKMASESGSTVPSLPLQPKFSNPLPSAEDVDETYNRLGDFPRRQISEPPPENIYGMASAVSTVGPVRKPPMQEFACGNEYEEADTVSQALSTSRRAALPVSNEYEDTAVQKSLKKSQISIPDDGDYADVK
ncbi:mediator of RNA polymerase II transcription subunit 1.1-like [Littorina saxatilis]|uniref:IRS-type PTB domain-containing protein n=1 Tax=Littorina saxatilis TaxID=31220 RepID=A0AAN9BQF6_9CAEN